jgi:sulfur carrier protein ThiS
MHYFEIEPQIEALVNETERNVRDQKLNELLEFLGSNPIEKVDKAFIAKNGKGIREFLNLV